MWLGLIFILPTLLLSFRKRKGQKIINLLKKRLIVSGFFLGLVTFMLFPNIARMPSQIYRRIDRTSLITPDDPLVVGLREQFISEQGGLSGFNNLSMEELSLEMNAFIQREIVWTEDIKTRLLVGDLSTPAEAISEGKDDCRGQAVTTVSILIGLGFDAYVAEQPWHFYTIVYNGSEEYKINQYGHLNNTEQYPILLIWNHEGYKYIRDPIGAFNVVMNSEPNVYDYMFDLGIGMILVGVIMGLGAALYSMVCTSDLRKTFAKNKAALKRLKYKIIIGIVTSVGLIGFLFGLFYLSGFGMLYFLLFGITLIFTLLNLEEFNEFISNWK